MESGGEGQRCRGLGRQKQTKDAERKIQNSCNKVFGCGSKPMESHFGVGAPPILGFILAGIGMFTGGAGFCHMCNKAFHHIVGQKPGTPTPSSLLEIDQTEGELPRKGCRSLTHTHMDPCGNSGRDIFS